MKDALVLDANDIKKLIAEKFGVPEKSVIKMQYSFAVVLEDDADKGTEVE